MDVRVGLWRKLSAKELMLLNCGVGEDSWESLGLQGDQSWVFFGRNDAKAETPVLWPPHAKSWLIGKDWCWERLRAGAEGDDRGWDGWTASLTRWTWVWVNSRSWWWTRRPGVLQFMGSQRVGHDWATELNWYTIFLFFSIVAYCRILNIVSCVYIRILFIHSIYKSLHLLIPRSQPTAPLHPSPLIIMNVLYVWESVSAL